MVRENALVLLPRIHRSQHAHALDGERERVYHLVQRVMFNIFHGVFWPFSSLVDPSCCNALLRALRPSRYPTGPHACTLLRVLARSFEMPGESHPSNVGSETGLMVCFTDQGYILDASERQPRSPAWTDACSESLLARFTVHHSITGCHECSLSCEAPSPDGTRHSLV